MSSARVLLYFADVQGPPVIAASLLQISPQGNVNSNKNGYDLTNLRFPKAGLQSLARWCITISPSPSSFQPTQCTSDTSGSCFCRSQSYSVFMHCYTSSLTQMLGCYWCILLAFEGAGRGECRRWNRLEGSISGLEGRGPDELHVHASTCAY